MFFSDLLSGTITTLHIAMYVVYAHVIKTMVNILQFVQMLLFSTSDQNNSFARISFSLCLIFTWCCFSKSMSLLLVRSMLL